MTSSFRSYTTPSSSRSPSFFFFNDTATTEIYTLSLHDALPISGATVPDRHRPQGERIRDERGEAREVENGPGARTKGERASRDGRREDPHHHREEEPLDEVLPHGQIGRAHV